MRCLKGKTVQDKGIGSHSCAGQSSVAYLLVLLIASALALSLSSEQMKRSLSILYTDMATRILQPGAMDSEKIHQQAEQAWGG